MGASATWFGPCSPFLGTETAHAAALSAYGSLATYCVKLRCAPTIRGECLRAVQAMGVSPVHLASQILGSLRQGGSVSSSPLAFSHLVREASRSDFEGGRVLNVDGWTLSVTETRVYALAALLAK